MNNKTGLLAKPLALDLCCGLGGWAHGLLAEGWDVIGFDIERHEYGGDKYPGQLVIQDIRTLDGSQFRGRVALVVASPPCTEFSYMAMPWTRGKQIANALRGKADFPKGYKGSRTIHELTALFDACVRIGREAGCPTLIENVRGAEKWVGRAKWAWGSFLLWGDVPALMPIPSQRRQKSAISCAPRNFSERIAATPEEAHRLHYSLPPKQEDIRSIRDFSGFKSQGMNWSDQSKKGQDFTRLAGEHCGHKQLSPARRAKHYDETAKMQMDGRKQPGISGKRTNGKGDKWFQDGAAQSGSKSNARKAASAMIAKIPFPLSSWIAKTMKPRGEL